MIELRTAIRGCVCTVNSWSDAAREASAEARRTKKYGVFIHKTYFPKELHKPGLAKEDFEQWSVNAGSRDEAAKQVWAKHGGRLLGLMGPKKTKMNRKIRLHVSGEEGTAPGRLDPILVHEGE